MANEWNKPNKGFNISKAKSITAFQFKDVEADESKPSLYIKGQLKSLYKVNEVIPLSVGRRIKIAFPNEDLKSIRPSINASPGSERINEIIKWNAQFIIPSIMTPNNQIRDSNAQFVSRVYTRGFNSQKYRILKSNMTKNNNILSDQVSINFTY